MKNIKLIILAVAVLFAACSQNQKAVSEKGSIDSTNTIASVANQTDSLTAKMQIKDLIKNSEPVILKFSVVNHADTAKSFCKWHTPFEPFISKYLDITDDKGNDVAYKGAMAKRIMPPPADGYVSIAAKDSVSAEVDLLQAYDLKPGNKYTLSYNSSSISGISIASKLTFELEK
ncbi:protease [Pedobacter aquatilis]|uniref:protease n=1 Tax=Pedobacter aquatilis TaxID=351343 RepID=UPI00293152C3|nr:protease [Pedobacter aquatilis]